MQQNDSMNQARFNQSLNMEQMQLSELQKISAQLQNTAITNGTVGGSVNSANIAGTMPQNMMSYPATGYSYSPSNEIDPQALFNQAVGLGGLALYGGNKLVNNAQEVGKSSANRVVSYIDRLQQSPFFAYKSMDHTRTSLERAEAIHMQSTHQLQNMGIKFGGTVGSMGLSSVAGALAGSAFGLPGAMVGSVAGSMVGDFATETVLKHTKNQQGYDRWLQANSKRFINMFETTSGLGAGFGQKDRKELSKFLSNANGDFLMSDNELATMLDQVTDAGLMKSTSDLEGFKKKFSSLVTTIKDGAKMLNTSYEEMVSMISDLNKMGIKDDQERLQTLAGVKTASQVTGQSESKAFNSINQMKNAIYGSGLADPTTSMQGATSAVNMASTFKEYATKIDSRYSEGNAYLYNRFNGDDQAFGSAMQALSGSILGNETIFSSLMPYIVDKDKNGNLTVNQARANEAIEGLKSGSMTIQQLASKGGDHLQSLGLDGGVVFEQLKAMGGDQMLSMLSSSLGVASTNDLLYQTINSLGTTTGLGFRGYLGQLGINDASAAAYEDMTHWNANAGKAIEKDTQQQTYSNELVNKARSRLGTSWWEKMKYNMEDVGEFMTSNMPTTERMFRRSKDWFSELWTDEDTAIKQGYSNVTKKDLSANEYRDVFNSMSSNLKVIDEEYGYSTASNLNKKKSLDKKVAGGIDTFFDVVTSPSKWDTGLSKLFGGNLDSLVSTSNTRGSKSATQLLSDIEESKKLSDEQKESLKKDIYQAQGQTQDIVTGALDVVGLIGGDKQRERLLDSVTIDEVTKRKTGARRLDDFSDADVLSKMSLEDQKNIQELAIKQAVKTVEDKFGGKEREFKKALEKAGLGENENVKNAFKDGEVTSKEMKKIVTSLMTDLQGGKGDNNFSQWAAKNADKTSDSTKQAKKSMESVNSNMEKLAKETNTFNETLIDAVKSMSKQLSELQVTVSRSQNLRG